jgi:hypothetical protein
MMNRRTQTTLPTSTSLLKPRLTRNSAANIAKKQAKQQGYYNRGAKTLGQLKKGERVKVQPFGQGEKKWSEGKVIREIRPRSYEVEANGRKYIRNRKHLRKCTPAQEPEVEEDIYLPMPVMSKKTSVKRKGHNGRDAKHNLQPNKKWNCQQSRKETKNTRRAVGAYQKDQ